MARLVLRTENVPTWYSNSFSANCY